MKFVSLVAIAIALHCWYSVADAGYIYATSIESSSGTFDSPLSQVLGTPNAITGVSGVVQFGSGSVLTLDLGSQQSGPGTLSIYTYDLEIPAAASIEISADGLAFSLVDAHLVDDTGPYGPPTNPDYPHANYLISSPIRYVRLTDLGDSGGFDLDAVGYLANDVQSVPEPASLTQFGIGALGLAIGRRQSRRRATTGGSGRQA